jgi:hypothetical protein
VVKAAGHPALVALTGNADGVGAAWTEALRAVDWSLFFCMKLALILMDVGAA